MNIEILLIAAALFLAFGNGANDNFKGFATVWGSDSLSYRQALILATVATAAGSLIWLTAWCNSFQAKACYRKRCWTRRNSWPALRWAQQ